MCVFTASSFGCLQKNGLEGTESPDSSDAGLCRIPSPSPENRPRISNSGGRQEHNVSAKAVNTFQKPPAFFKHSNSWLFGVGSQDSESISIVHPAPPLTVEIVPSLSE